MSARPDAAVLWDTAEAGVLVRMQGRLWQCIHMTVLSTESCAGHSCAGHAMPSAEGAVALKQDMVAVMRAGGPEGVPPQQRMYMKWAPLQTNTSD